MKNKNITGFMSVINKIQKAVFHTMRDAEIPIVMRLIKILSDISLAQSHLTRLGTFYN